MGRSIQISFVLLLSAVLCVYARPGGVAIAGGAAIAKPLISFDGGNVGVNFGGYSASAGLGGLLSGDATRGGLHAEAGTPHGQAAAAGLAGGVGGSGYAAGGLYAGATAGGGVSAGTSLTGVSAGTGYSGEKVIYKPEQVLSEKTVTEEAKVVHTQKIQATPVVHRTIIEKTVIPNYVEKTIQVPSYVEKTIRVPTVIEKKVRVEAEPTIYEKTYDVPAHHAPAVATGVVSTGHIGVNQEVGVQVSKPVAPATVGFEKRVYFGPTKFYPRRHFGLRKRVHYGTYGYPTGGFFSNIFGGGGAIGGGAYAGGGAYGGGGTTAVSSAGVGGASAGSAAGGGATFTATGYKQTNPTLFNDIFNIPISALGAVNNLLNNFGGRASGGIAVSKGYSAGNYY